MILRVFLWALATFFLVAIFEYGAHRLMHRLVGTKIHREHTLLHHAQGIDTPDLLDLRPLTYLKFGGFMILLLGWIDVIGAIALSLGFLIHGLLWTRLHRQIHGFETNWSRLLPGYAGLRRHHLAHHARTDRNYAVVFPFMDRLLGTWSARGAASCKD